MEGLVRLGAAPRTRAAGKAATLTAIRATAAYEFRMQIRRRSLWLVLGLLGLYLVWILPEAMRPADETTIGRAENWAMLVQILMPIAFGVMLADRFPRDRKLRVDEILETTPASMEARLIGKFVGATAATLVPVVGTLAAGCVWLAFDTGDPAGVIAGAGAAFLLVNLPGLLFVAAFSVCCPLIMPVPVYQFLYVGYWFWGNLMPTTVMPTLRDTWLAPIGLQSGIGILGIWEGADVPKATPLDGVISIAILLLFACAALFAGWLVLRFERDRR